MAEITRIEQQKKDPRRCSIYIDGTFYCGLKAEVVIKNHLKAGMQLDEKMLDELQLENEKGQALDKALTHLSATMKTQKQMTDFLTKKGYTQPVIDYCLEKLNYYGYVDDEAYCRAYVNSVQGKGKAMLRQDLYKRGADPKAIEAVLDEVEEDGDEALAVAQKYLRGKVCDQKNRQRAFRYLMSKGYSYDVAQQALAKIKDASDEDDTF